MLSAVSKSAPNPFELLPLWEITDDVIVTSHGVYLCGFELFGIDSEHSESDVTHSAAQALYSAFKNDIPENTLLQFMVVGNSDYRNTFERFEAIPEPENPVLAHQRRKRLEFLRNSNLRRHSVYLFVGSMEGFTERQFATLSTKLHQERTKAVRQLGQVVRQALERTQEIWLRPLNTDRLTRLYDEELNSQHPISLPQLPVGNPVSRNSVIDELSCVERLLRAPVSGGGGSHMKLGNRLCKVLTLKAMPEQNTYFPMMETLFHLGFDFRASVNLFQPKQEAFISHINRRQTGLKARSEANPHRTRQRDLYANREATALETAVNVDHEKIYQAGMQIVVYGATERQLEYRTATVTSYLKKLGLLFFEDNGAHDREFFKTLPGMATTFDRWRFATGSNAVDLMPIFMNAPGDDKPVFLIKNDRDELVSFDPMEPLRDNWNVLLLGASGAGKSVFLNTAIMTSMLGNLRKGRLMVVDYAGEEKSSYLNLVRSFGGVFLQLLDHDSDLGMNPFPHPKTALQPNGNIKRGVLGFLTTIIDTLVANTGEDMDALLYRGIIRRALIYLYKQPGRTEAPLFGDLYDVLRTFEGRADVEQDKLTRLMSIIRDSILEDPDAALLNRPSKLTDINDSFVVFDLHGVEGLEKRIREALTFTVCHHIMQMAFDSNDYNYKYVVLDEVAQLLENPEMRKTIARLYRTARKHNTSIWTATQNYEDYVASGIAGTLALCSSTHLLLSHKKAASVRELVIKNLKMGPRAAHLFSDLVTRKGQYSKGLLTTKIKDHGRSEERDITAVIKVELSPFDYELATSDPSDRSRQEKYIKANPQFAVHEVLEYLAQQRASISFQGDAS